MPETKRKKFERFLKNIGPKAGMLLKGLAVFVLVAGILLSLIAGIMTAAAGNKSVTSVRNGVRSISHPADFFFETNAAYLIAGLIIFVAGCAGSIFTSLLILGFGQLVEEHTLMRKLMERQMGLPEDPEPESGKAEKPQDVPPTPPVPPTPEVRYKSGDQQEEAFSPRADYAYTSSVEDEKEAEERLRVKWRTDKKKDGPDSGTDVKA